MADCLYHGYSGGSGPCEACRMRERGFPDPEFDAWKCMESKPKRKAAKKKKAK